MCRRIVCLFIPFFGFNLLLIVGCCFCCCFCFLVLISFATIVMRIIGFCLLSFTFVCVLYCCLITITMMTQQLFFLFFDTERGQEVFVAKYQALTEFDKNVIYERRDQWQCLQLFLILVVQFKLLLFSLKLELILKRTFSLFIESLSLLFSLCFCTYMV